MPKKIIENDSDSSTESEPEQYETINEPKPKVKIIKLEKANKKKQVEEIKEKEKEEEIKADVSVKPKRIMSEKQLEALRIARENRKKATVEATPEPAVEDTHNKKPLSKLNKNQLKLQADLLNIDITDLTNAQIIKKIRESQETQEIDSPKKNITVKEIHHHHYKDKEDVKPKKIKKPSESQKAEPQKAESKVNVKKETKIINFV